MSSLTKEEIENLEELSFRNCCLFYREELLRIHKGTSLYDVGLTDGLSYTLRRYGILKTVYILQKGSNGRRCRGLILTDKAKEILGLKEASI